MIEKELEVKGRAGIHARPASALAKTASSFSSSVFIIKDAMKVNAKSIMGIITLGATYKTKLLFQVEGKDEKEAMAAIERLFDNQFEET